MSWPEVVTRLLAFLVLAWPLLATATVFALRRAHIARPGRFLLVSTLSGYVLSVCVPLAIVLAGALLGKVAEVATLYAIFFSIPVLALLHPAVAWFWSVRLAESTSPGEVAGGEPRG